MLNQADNNMIESCMAIAVSLATQYAKANPTISLEDLIQEGYVVLCQSVTSYKKTKTHTSKFSTYAWKSIARHLSKYCQREKSRVPTFSLTWQNGDSSDWTYADIPVRSPEQQILQGVRDEEIRRNLLRLSRRLRANAKLGAEMMVSGQDEIWKKIKMPYAKYARCILAARLDLSTSKEVRELFNVRKAG